MKVKVIFAEPREKGTVLPAEEGHISSLVAGNSAFALKLYRWINKQECNLVFSPYSISAALAMTYAGARGVTEAEMAECLNFNLDQRQLHPAFKSLDDALKQSAETGLEGTGGFNLRIVNSIWGQKGFDFLGEFLDILAKNYGSGLNLVDFKGKTEESRRAINDWVLEHTEGKIDELVGRGIIDSSTRLVLTNAIYFKGGWKYPFEPYRTAEDLFRLQNGEEIFVPMMKHTMLVGYAENENCRAVELPYKGNSTSMVILMPAFGKRHEFIDALDEPKLTSILESLKTTDVTLTMPRFKFKFNLALKQALGEMGMKSAFTGNADFSAITREGDLYLQDVVHKAFVAVDEEGTEAAAATAAIAGIKSFAPLAVQFKLDCPFIFLIRHNSTGAVLFIGQVVNPLA